MAGDRGALLVRCVWATGIFPATITEYPMRENGTIDEHHPKVLDAVQFYDKAVGRVRVTGITEGTVDALRFDEAGTPDADTNANVLDFSHIGDQDGVAYEIADIANGALTVGRNMPTGMMGAFAIKPVFVTSVPAEVAPGAGTIVEFLLKD